MLGREGKENVASDFREVHNGDLKRVVFGSASEKRN